MIFITEWSTQSTPLPHDPFDIFSLFFNDNLVGMIVEENIRYAEQCLQETNKQWSTNAEDIRAYLGFIILMEKNRLSEIRDYWSVDKNLRYAPIADRISRDTSTLQTMTSYLLVAKTVSHACRLILSSPL